MNPDQSPHPQPPKTSPPQNAGASSRRWQRVGWVFAVPASVFMLLYVFLYWEQYAVFMESFGTAGTEKVTDPWQGWRRFHLDEIFLVLGTGLGLLAGLCRACGNDALHLSFWRRTWGPALALLILGSAACLAWRWEMEWAWEVKKEEWLRHFFWAIPAAVAAFIGWAVWTAPVRRRWLLAAALVVLAGGCAWIAWQAILAFTVGLRTRLLGWDETVLREHFAHVHRMQILAIAMWATIPVLFALTCRGFGARISWLRTSFSAALFVLSWPLATVAALLFDLVPFGDPVQVLKSGAVIPLLIFSLGLPLLGASRRQT